MKKSSNSVCMRPLPKWLGDWLESTMSLGGKCVRRYLDSNNNRY